MNNMHFMPGDGSSLMNMGYAESMDSRIRPWGFGGGFGRPGGFGFGRPFGFGFGRPFGFGFGAPFLGGFAGGLAAGALLGGPYGGYGYPYPYYGYPYPYWY